VNMLYALTYFRDVDSARYHRRNVLPGGGWIFAADDGDVILFPFGPEWTPTAIMRHPATHGKNGSFL